MLTAPPQPADEQAVATIAAAIRRWEGEGDADYPDHEGTGRGYWGGAVEHTKPSKLVAVLSHSYTPHSSAPPSAPPLLARIPRGPKAACLRVPAVPVDANPPNSRRAQFARGSSGSRGATASSVNFLLPPPSAAAPSAPTPHTLCSRLLTAARCKLDAHKAPSLKGLCVDTLLKSGTDEYKALDAHTAASEAVQSVLDEQGRQADAAQPVAIFDGAPRGDSHMPRTLATWQSRRSLECASPALLGFASSA